MGRAVGAAQYRLTQEERAELHTALFARLLHEVKGGSLVDAARALDLINGDVAADLLGALVGDNGIPDGAGDGTRLCGPDAGESVGL